MYNIVIPMAGRGKRFVDAGYHSPKPLIDIAGQYMIELVVKNLTPAVAHRFIFICQKEHLNDYPLEETLRSITKESVIIPIDYVTEGAACTVLLAKEYINDDNPLMIANSDQYIDSSIDEYLDAMKDLDGMIMTMPACDPKWSFIQYNSNGFVTMVREKEVISNEATVGIYNYAKGREFIYYAETMIKKNIRVNGEFYVAPVYNERSEAGKHIGFWNIGDNMHGLGTPEDLEVFMEAYKGA